MLLSRRAISAPTQITITPKQYDTECVCDRETDRDVEYIRYLACVLDCPVFLFFYSILTPEIALYITLPFSLLSGVRAYITPVFWGHRPAFCSSLPPRDSCHPSWEKHWVYMQSLDTFKAGFCNEGCQSVIFPRLVARSRNCSAAVSGKMSITCWKNPKHTC